MSPEGQGLKNVDKRESQDSTRTQKLTTARRLGGSGWLALSRAGRSAEGYKREKARDASENGKQHCGNLVVRVHRRVVEYTI